MSKPLLLFLIPCLLFASLEKSPPVLKRIDLLQSPAQIRKKPKPAGAPIQIKGVTLLEKNPTFQKQLYPFLGQPLTKEVIDQLREKIASLYQKNNQPLVVITVPKQDLKDGVLQLVIDEVKLGKIRSKGSKHFPLKWFTQEIRTKPGEPIDTQTFLQDLYWLNLNPFRKTRAVFKPGEVKGVADLDLITIDRWPYRVYAGVDNTGTEETDPNRLFFGFNFGKTVPKDGQISYQYTFSPNWNLFSTHTGSCRIPLPWRHVWLLWGGYTEIKPKLEPRGMSNRGVSWQVDSRYQIPLIFPSSIQSITIGYDFKETNNDINFNGDRISTSSADINQFTLGYQLGLKKKGFKTELEAELFFSPGGITHADTDRAYQTLRLGAKARYLYFKAFHSTVFKLNKGAFSYKITGQLSSENLLPSEQLIMTGREAVRGFAPRSLLLDNGAILNLTYQTPSISIFPKSWKMENQLYFLTFFDGGVGNRHLLVANEKNIQYLGSVGAGVRYEVTTLLSCRFDYGIPLFHKGFASDLSPRYNFGFVMSY